MTPPGTRTRNHHLIPLVNYILSRLCSASKSTRLAWAGSRNKSRRIEEKEIPMPQLARLVRFIVEYRRPLAHTLCTFQHVFLCLIDSCCTVRSAVGIALLLQLASA